MARSNLRERLIAAVLNQQIKIDVNIPPNLPHEVKVGEIIAYRFWFVLYSKLHSISRDHFWVPGPQPKIQTLDYRNYGNGYYAHKSLTRCHSSAEEWCYRGRIGNGRSIVIGTVALFDEVIEHENGYRAQSAKIISLDYSSYSDLDRLRKDYGVYP